MRVDPSGGRRRSIAALILLAWTVAPQLSAAAGVEPIVLRGRTMGTTYSIKCWSSTGKSTTAAELQDKVDTLLFEFDRQMSTYREDSELSRFNRAPAGEWFAVSRETAHVVEEAIRIHRITGGASDVTVAPLVRLWSFGPGSPGRVQQVKPPSDEQVDAALRLVGAQHLAVRDEPPAIKKSVDGMEVDLSSMAPGYAVDLAIKLLCKKGMNNALVEIGGEVRAAGLRPDGTQWVVGVESPAASGGTLARRLPLRDLALATSGDYRNFRTADGKRWTHIIDPRTGRPLPFRGATATVVSDTCLEADAQGTALFVMGEAAGYDWCVEHDVAALFQRLEEDGQVAVRATPRFEKLFAAP